MKVSVIVPVYNVEQYLRRCIDSIINQTYKNLEIILVDDGSPDNCGDICEEYLLRDNRIRVIHKENGGISSARNVGLDNINGEYIVFVDSDDFIEPELIESCLNYIRQNGVDVVFFNWKVLYKDKELFHSINKTFMKSYEEAFRSILEDKTPCYVWNKFYKRNLWDDIRFPLGVNVEDLIIMPHVLMRAKRIGYIEEYFYNYNRGNSTSVTSSISAKNKYGYFYAWSDRRKIAIAHNDSKFSFYCKKRAIRSAVTAYGLNTVENVLLPQQINHIKQYCLIEKESCCLSGVGFREKVLCYGVLKCELICKIYGEMMFLFEKAKRFLR